MLVKNQNRKREGNCTYYGRTSGPWKLTTFLNKEREEKRLFGGNTIGVVLLYMYHVPRWTI